MTTTSRTVLALVLAVGLMGVPAAMAQQNGRPAAQSVDGLDEDAARQLTVIPNGEDAAAVEDDFAEDDIAGDEGRLDAQVSPETAAGQAQGDDALPPDLPPEDEVIDVVEEDLPPDLPEDAVAEQGGAPLGEVTECDSLTASPFDTGAVTEAVPFDRIDAPLAIDACSDALEADPENPRFKLQLGRAYEADEQYDRALPLYEEAAVLGYGEAMWALGTLYRDGKRVRQDYDTAREWYEKGAEAGSANSLMALGGLYFNGWGVPKDYDAAADWYGKAADAGHPGGNYRLGYFHENGYGFSRDYERAYDFYSKAAEAGYGDAMYGIANLYSSGHYGDGDGQLAYEWLQKSYDAGSRLGLYALATLYDGSSDYVKHDGQRAAELFYESIRYGQRQTIEAFVTDAQQYGLDTRRDLQRLLSRDNYYRGRPDAVYGPDTIEAIADASGWDAGELLDLYYQYHDRNERIERDDRNDRYQPGRDNQGGGYNRSGGGYNRGGGY